MVELLRSFVLDQTVRQDAGAVDQPVDRPPVLPNLRQGPGQRGLVTHIHAEVADVGAGLAQWGEVLLNLTLLENLPGAGPRLLEPDGSTSLLCLLHEALDELALRAGRPAAGRLVAERSAAQERQTQPVPSR